MTDKTQKAKKTEKKPEPQEIDEATLDSVGGGAAPKNPKQVYPDFVI